MSRVTLVTVNYRNDEATGRLRQSLDRQTDRDFDFIVVDNSEHNRGFSGGCNFGIHQALERGADWVLLINNDTTVEPDFIVSLPLDTPGLVSLPLEEKGVLVRRTYVDGAGMLIHRSVFDSIGFLDERYFLYYEDVDFTIRARRAGVTIIFAQRPIIHHAASATTSRLGTPLLLRYHARNKLLLDSQHGAWWVRGLLPFTALFGIIYQSLKILMMPSRRVPSRAIRAGIIDFYAKRFGHITENQNRN